MPRDRQVQDPGGFGLPGTKLEPPGVIVPDDADEEEPVTTDRERPLIASAEEQATEGKSRRQA